MSQLLARILLSVFIIPLAGIIYLIAFFLAMEWRWPRYYDDRVSVMFFAGLTTWAFMAGYWILLWRSVVRWDAARVLRTIGCFVAAGVLALILGLLLNAVDRGFGYFMASITAPILWLAGTVPIWRETKQERAERLRNANSDTVVCPTCGYNLTGLSESRCPECGSKFTLNDLLAGQPARKMAEIEE